MTHATGETTSYVGRGLLPDNVQAEASLEDIYDSYADSLFRYATAITGSAEDAEDAVQEVFIRIARQPDRLCRAKSLKAYLFTAARNAAFSILRKKRRGRELQESLLHDLRMNFSAESISVESATVGRAFSVLPVEQREVLILKIYDELTFREIAETIGASMGTVTARYRYGIAKLRRSLEDESNG